MNFEIKGYFIKNGQKHKFSRIVDAKSEKLAEEKIKCLFGSEHKLNRRHIIIEGINKLGDNDG
ncbi:MAG: 50S ribosomal protein L18Ae [Candidatus Diapherotrites archaeon]|nr:50S ribosomal protein L18Ae [Candidatus Diapherotrites archaeon]